MKWLRETGLEAAIKRCVSRGVPLFGICGGYQMLGKKISDPEASEGGGEIRGMELLDTETVFRQSKTRTRISGRVSCRSGFFSCVSGAEFEGYEIHMGETASKDNVFAALSDGRRDGAYSGNVGGCYVHGFFDRSSVSGAIVKALLKENGIEYGGAAVDRKEYKQSQYDMIADAVRKNIDMELIYKIIKRIV